ncbi:TonB-dependent receptor plug domain-containing protein [Telmatobacter bradus]|uniref:TonB-dependent receptor plug domain-containing protein n=1 Tax=Telmatobacter bradus TaxID=474953 RepID=UPI003B43BB8D
MRFISSFLTRNLLTRASQMLALLLLGAVATAASAASIHGTVTDATGARLKSVHVLLVCKGKVVGQSETASDGSFQILTGTQGHLFLLLSADNFRQLQTPDFYAGRSDVVEKTLVMEPAWVHESVVVTATGTPTPQAQTSATTTVLSQADFALSTDLVSAMRMMPGVSVVQTEGRGSWTSLFVRGGVSTDNLVLMDGIDVDDLGSQFDFGALSTNNLESVEVYRGPNSNLFGAGAMTSVVSLTTAHGTTNFPSVILEAEGGSLYTTRESLTVAGTHGKLDYLGAYGWLQTSNDLPRDEHHLASTVANLGWQPTASTVVRGTLHYNVAATGVPNAWDFYHVADDSTQKDQDLYLSSSISNQTTESFHNTVRYGLTRKREQLNLWSMQGTPVSYSYACYSAGSLGQTVTITGANGYSATGQATLDCGTYGDQFVSNRDALTYNGDVKLTPHLAAMVGFQYEDERGAEPGSAYYGPVERSNYNYIANVHGDYKNRFFYTLGGNLEHYSLFGTQTSPRAGFSWYAFKPRKGVFSSTRILFNYGDAVREPKLTDQDYSLYNLLQENGAQSSIAALHISPLTAPSARTYEGGLAQSFLGDHINFRVSYFHNQFGRELEYVGSGLLSEVLTGMTASQKQELLVELNTDGIYGAEVNSQAFRAQGIESSIESGIGRNLSLRGGYTYLDAVVERSFDSDNEALLEGYAPTYNGISIGSDTPLVGARPFRRPPHTGYFTAIYASHKLTGVFASSYASRSDDSTMLGYMDASGGNSLLLPNRDLDHGFAKLDLGGSYQLIKGLSVYAQGENLLNQEHIAPIGYRSLPFTLRVGVKLSWGPGSGR